MEKQEEEFTVDMCKKLLRSLRGRLKTLEKYRDTDIDGEILHILNDIIKYKQKLEELRNEKE